jgi:hypothetical protein
MYDHLWDQVLPFLERIRRCYSTPYTWDKKSQAFVLIKSPKYVKVFSRLSTMVFIHMTVLTWNLLQTLQKESNLLLKMIGIGVTAVTFFMTVNRWMYNTIAQDIVHFLNCAVALQRRTREDAKKGMKMESAVK